MGGRDLDFSRCFSVARWLSRSTHVVMRVLPIAALLANYTRREEKVILVILVFFTYQTVETTAQPGERTNKSLFSFPTKSLKADQEREKRKP